MKMMSTLVIAAIVLAVTLNAQNIGNLPTCGKAICSPVIQTGVIEEVPGLRADISIVNDYGTCTVQVLGSYI